jgi:hypothetical protein
LESDEWTEYADLVGVPFTEFEELGLPRDAPDRVVWQACQTAGVVLIPANRAGDEHPLDETIRELSDDTSLPVITIADAQRLLRDRTYAEAAVARLLFYLETMDNLRGTGRLYIP